MPITIADLLPTDGPPVRPSPNAPTDDISPDGELAEGSRTFSQAERLTGWLRLAFTPGIGPVSARLLARQFSRPDAVFAARFTELSQLLDEARARAILEPCPRREQLIAQALQWQRDTSGATLMHLDHPAYPAALSSLDDAPPVLFCQGPLGCLEAPALAIVGSRSASFDGICLARDIAHALSSRGWLIVSGLANGIDAAAHEGALNADGATAAVLGTGIDQVYPRNNRALAARIACQGILISEQALGTEPARANFPRRNRIIAGLSLGVLVVQAARQSGSLITARLASELGREVMAVPGSIHSPLSKGCHQLLRQGATLIESADDVLEELAGPLGALVLAARASRHNCPAGAAQVIPKTGGTPAVAPLGHRTLRAMGWAPVTADSLAERLTLEPGILARVLLELELNGLIERLADGTVARCKKP
jgi:DNA processing protein